MIWLITCFVLAFAPVAGVAQERNLNPDQEARLVTLVEDGKAAYDNGEFGAAREKFVQAYDLYPHPDILYRIALCHERLGEDQQAVEYYRRFLTAAPDAPERARIEKTIEVIETRISKSEIRVTSQPDGAAVFIDDEANGVAGRTPTALPVKPGNYKLIVKKDGYETVSELVTVTSGNSLQVRYQLEPTRGAAAAADPVVADRRRGRRGPSVKLVTLLVVGVVSGVSSVVFFRNYAARKDELGSKPRAEFTRAEYQSLERRAYTNLGIGITTGAIAAFSLIWAYGLWLSESSVATALLPSPGWTNGPAVGWTLKF